MTGSPHDIEGQALENLKVLLEEALAKISALGAENAALRAEIARLKGLKGPPSIKPSGMEQASGPKPAGGKGKRRRRGASGLRRRSRSGWWWPTCRRDRGSKGTRLIRPRSDRACGDDPVPA